MFEITAEDISRLNDEQLRSVVARLCEAELRGRGHSAACVTWGGNQNAADGGIDVRVALPPGSATDGFIPRTATGFQVKQQDMPAGQIADEMRPRGNIRPCIQSLADQSGAYIIVSSQGSTADSALASRRDAMRLATTGVCNADVLALDFYDRTRIASWVRSHEGLVPWVRALVGRSIPGWQSYGSWAYPADVSTAEYLFDDKIRLHSTRQQTDQGLSAKQGIAQIRDELRHPGHVARLVGLSGVGKTRFAQALFDAHVGSDSLDPSLAIYTNTADGPEPQPVHLASELAVAGTRAILIIDNCRSDLHCRLSEVCRQPASRLSLITIEYDIREDEPEQTEVFKLESSSPELIEKLIRRRFPNLSQIDAQRIAAAELCGGNARIAIALAATVGRNETIAGFTDDNLFQRLFHQRHAPDPSLLRAAQACSLVYSFQGEDTSDSAEAELYRIGKLIGQTPQEVYGSVGALLERDLAQRRGVWRAVLPQAVADRLAAAALKIIPYPDIERQILTSERLLRSFSRRLGYLHGSEEAVGIVKRWFGFGGLLGNVSDLNELRRTILDNVAPAAPDDALAGLERALTGWQGAEVAEKGRKYYDLLRSIAYDAALFSRCMSAFVAILVMEDVPLRGHGKDIFTSLFHLSLSGTHAAIEQRVAVIESLLHSRDDRRRTLGALALGAALQTGNYLGVGTFDFGNLSRDFGYWPRSGEEVEHWFSVVLKLAETIACGSSPAALQVQAVLAERSRNLWNSSGNADELIGICLAIRRLRFWPEGWRAVRETLDLHGETFPGEYLAKLTSLERMLAPTDLLQRVRGVVLSSRRLPNVYIAAYEDHSTEEMGIRIARTDALARDLGRELATDSATLNALLPEIVTSEGRTWQLGEGLAIGATDAPQMWERLVEALTATEASARRQEVLRGFLRHLRTSNTALTAALLDDAVEHETLAECYPFLQVAVDLETSDIARLKRSLGLGKAPAGAYACLKYGRATDPVPPSDLRELILTIAAMPSGYDVAIEILYMRLHSYTSNNQTVAPETVETGCELLQQLAFAGNDRQDYHLADIVRGCLKGARGVTVVADMCRRLKTAVANHETSSFDHEHFLIAIFTTQPVAALDGICGGGAEEFRLGISMLRASRHHGNPLAGVSESDLLNWCDHDPQTRYSALAPIITTIKPGGEDGPSQWTSVALRFLEKAPFPSAILRQFVSGFQPSEGWMGSLATILESNTPLLDQLGDFPSLANTVSEQRESVRKRIEDRQHEESVIDRRDERFE